mgnify:FL=1
MQGLLFTSSVGEFRERSVIESRQRIDSLAEKKTAFLEKQTRRTLFWCPRVCRKTGADIFEFFHGFIIYFEFVIHHLFHLS